MCMYRIFGRILYGTVIPYLRSIRSRMHGVAELPHGGSARICSRQVLFPYSRKPFKQGIKPDMEVKFTIDDLMKGRDPVVEKAVAFLQTRKNETAYLTSDDR